MKPLIDVIMPALNREKYIGVAIESILAQSCADFRLIVVDNGSVDGTKAIAESYDDPRIDVFDGPEMNLPQVLNFAMSKGSAPYIARMDSDDFSYPERLRLTLEKMQSDHDLCVVSGALEVCGANLDIGGKLEAELDPISVKRKLIAKNTIYNGASLFRRDAYEAIGGYDPRFVIAEDYELFLRMRSQGGMANVPDVLLKYRKHNGSSITDRRELIMYTAFARFNAVARELGMDELDVSIDEAGEKRLGGFVAELADVKIRGILRRAMRETTKKLQLHSVLPT